MSDSEKRFEIIVQRLRENHHKITPQRLAIIQTLSESMG